MIWFYLNFGHLLDHHSCLLQWFLCWLSVYIISVYIIVLIPHSSQVEKEQKEQSPVSDWRVVASGSPAAVPRAAARILRQVWIPSVLRLREVGRHCTTIRTLEA